VGVEVEPGVALRAQLDRTEHCRVERDGETGPSRISKSG